MREATFPLPIWWQTIEAWDLARSDRARLIQQLTKIDSDDGLRRRFLSDLLTDYRLQDADPNEIYGSLLVGAAPPMMRHTGPVVNDDAFLAGALAYQTVVVADPVWIAHRYFLWAERARANPTLLDGSSLSPGQFDDAIEAMAMFGLREYLPDLLPLAREGAVTFDALWSAPVLAKDIWDRVPTTVLLEWKRTWHHREIAAEAVWAVAQCLRFGATIGTQDPEFASVVRLVSDRESREPLAATEISVMLPYVTGLRSDEILSLRQKHQDSLAPFRGAMFSMTRELRNMQREDLTERRVREAVKDHLDGELAKLSRELKSSRVIVAGAATTAGVSLATAALRVAADFPVGFSALLPLASSGVAAATAIGTQFIEGARLRGNSLYVLWQAARRSSSSRRQRPRGSRK